METPPRTLPPRPPRRSKKIQAFLTEQDYEALRRTAESNGELPGALASRALSQLAEDIRALEVVREGA